VTVSFSRRTLHHGVAYVHGIWENLEEEDKLMDSRCSQRCWWKNITCFKTKMEDWV